MNNTQRKTLRLAATMLFILTLVLSSTAITFADNSGVNSKPTLKQLRDKYNDAGTSPIGVDTFSTLVDVNNYTPGVYTQAANTYAQKYINFMRYQAGIGEITLTQELNNNAAQGALIMARNKKFDHSQPVPNGVSESAAAPGQYATSASNISSQSASSLWIMNVTESAILGQMQDDRGSNLQSVGHRRWLLAPSTSTMGIGSALQDVKVDGWYEAYTAIRIMNRSATHNSAYGTVQKNNSTDYDFVAWPSSGYMLNKVFKYSTPWSISINEDRYSAIPDNVQVVITRKSDQKKWTLNKNNTLTLDDNKNNISSYLIINNNSSNSITGEGHCLVFAPKPSELGTSALEGEFDVSVTNLKTKAGASTSIQYTVNFKSLEPDMSEMNISLNASSLEYTGSALKPSATVKYDSTTLTEGTDYTLSYENNINVGTAKVTVTGKGKYKGSVNKTFTITPKKITAPTFTGGLVYNGKQQTALSENDFYTVTNGSATNAGSYTATVSLRNKTNTVWSNNSTSDLSINWSIAKAGLTEANVAANIPANGYTYDGSSKQPAITVSIGSTVLDSSNYIVSYTNNINAGEQSSANPPTVTIQGKGNCEGSVSRTFTISPKTLSGATITLSQSSYVYDGTSKCPETTVRVDGKTLTKDDDYSVACTDNVNVGTAKVTITGKGNYKDSTNKTFAITQKSLTGATITLSHYSYVYDGTTKSPEPTVTLNGKTLAKDTDYSVSYNNNVNAGTANVSISGKGNYKDSANTTFTITQKSLMGATLTLSQSSYVYDGATKRPEATVMLDGKNLVKDVDYNVAYSNNENAGTANVTITGKGNYKETAEKTFAIIAKELTDEMVGNIDPIVGDGSAKSPDVSVKDGSKTLVKDTDYTVVYSNNIDEGTAKATVTGKGNYKGTVNRLFEIISQERQNLFNLIEQMKQEMNSESDEDFKAALSEAIQNARQVAEDKTAGTTELEEAITNAETARAAAQTALEEKKAAQAAQNGKTAEEEEAARRAVEQLDWNGTLSGAVPAAKSVKAKAAKKSVKVSWKKATKKNLKKFDKVEIQVCTDRGFNRANTKRVEVKKSKKSATVKGLAKGMTYYVRVRDVKGSGTGKLVSKWSGVKKVKIKK